jgi:eukaryotic-like serine/threonine-protein kinase
MPTTNFNDPRRITCHDPNVATTAPDVNAPFGQRSSVADGGMNSNVPTHGAEPKGVEPERSPAAVSVPGYEIEGVLGRGGMGVVFRARHLALKRIVALKMVLAGRLAGPGELARFRIEAEAVARLQHPNIVQIHEVGAADGHPYCALEFVEGGNLAGKIDGQPMPAREAAKLVEALARAMQLAHSRNVVHRDLKPANILLAADGTPKITDFGLARQMDSDSRETQAGAVMGTPSYMAPELASGRAHEAGPAADVYALGAILYDCLAGRPPFKGQTTIETLDQVRTQEPVPPSRWQCGVPLDLETICLMCLRKEPERRYASAQALAEDVRRWQMGEPVQARPVGRGERAVKWVRRNPVLTGAVFVVTTSLLLGTAVSTHFGFEAAREAKKARENEQTAKVQEAAAKEKEAEAVSARDEARRLALLAAHNEKRAVENQKLAVDNEKRAKKTAEVSFKEIVLLSKELDQRLQSKHLSVHATPELRKLREDVLAMLRKSLSTVNRAFGISNFGEAASYQALGDLFANLGDSKEALAAYQKGVELVQVVADAQPDNDLARGNLGLMIGRLGNVALDMQGDALTARARCTQARSIHQEILSHPRNGFFPVVEIKRIISHDDLHLGKAFLALGQSREALKYFEECLSYRQTWSDAQPQSVPARSYVMEARMWSGIASAHLGDDQKTKDYFRLAVQRGEELVREFPKDFSFQGDLGEVQGAWGDVLLRKGQMKEAEMSYLVSLGNLEQALAHHTEDLALQQLLCLAHERLGVANASLSKPLEAEKHNHKALQLRMELLEVRPNNLAWQTARVLALARCGKHSEAAQEAAKLRSRVSNSTGFLLQLARGYAVCAGVESPQKAQYVAKALEALKTAMAADYRDAAVLQTDPDLDAVRAEAAFQKIVAEVKAR